MQRYFVSKQSLNKATFLISHEDYRHITRVMRMKLSDNIICSDGKRTALCEIRAIAHDNVTVAVVDWLEESPELPVSVTIAQGIPKGDKLDKIVQKGTELGATAFVPFAAERSIVKWTKEKAQRKLERLQKIAKGAAEQSHRQRIPTVSALQSRQALLQTTALFDVKLVAYEESENSGELMTLPNVLSSVLPGQSIVIVIGPEGGLDEGEVEQFKENGFVVCGLGPRILRTETAALYFLSIVSYATEFND